MPVLLVLSSFLWAAVAAGATYQVTLPGHHEETVTFAAEQHQRSHQQMVQQACEEGLAAYGYERKGKEHDDMVKALEEASPQDQAAVKKILKLDKKP